MLAVLVLPATSEARLCQFGYADISVGDRAIVRGWLGAQNAGVQQDSGRIIPLDGMMVEAHERNISWQIKTMNDNGIRPLIDLTDVLWSSALTQNPNCGFQYERGHLRAGNVHRRQQQKSAYLAKLDSFLALNASRLGTANIRGFIVHIEVNNNCVVPWQVNQIAQKLIDRNFGPSQGYILAAGYGLTYTDTPEASAISTGMPTGAFPSKLTHITPWAYDVFTLQANSVYNLNVDVDALGATPFWDKLVGKLSPSQKVIWGMTAICGDLQEVMFNGSHLTPGDRLGTQCDAQAGHVSTWPLAALSDHWRSFALRQPKLDGLIAISWTSPIGTHTLNSGVAASHATTGSQALTCE